MDIISKKTLKTIRKSKLLEIELENFEEINENSSDSDSVVNFLYKFITNF